MMLKGKCLRDFKKWLFENYQVKDIGGNYGWFATRPFSMQYGVLVDFFDSVGVIVEIEYFGNSSWAFSVYTYDVSFEPIPLQKTPRTEARQKAILKACEIYNSKKG